MEITIWMFILSGFYHIFPQSTEGCTFLTAYSSTNYFDSHDEYGTSDYNTGQEECWVITAQYGSFKVRAWTTNDLDLERNTCNDHVDVYCGSSSSGTRIDRFCDDDVIDDVYSDDNELYIEFKSDSSSTGDGFRIYYAQESTSETSCGSTSGSSSSTQLSSTTVSGSTWIILGCLGGVALVIFVACLILRSIKVRHRRSRTTRATTLPPDGTVQRAPPQPRQFVPAVPQPPPPYTTAPPVYPPPSVYPPPVSDPAYPPGMYPPPPPSYQ